MTPCSITLAVNARWRSGSSRCRDKRPEKVILHRLKNYSNNSDDFPREINIIARRIQQIVTCYDIFSSHKHFKVGQVFDSAVSVVFRKVALAFIPAAVLHARFPYHTPVWYGPPVCTSLDITCIKLLTTGAVSH